MTLSQNIHRSMKKVCQYSEKMSPKKG